MSLGRELLGTGVGQDPEALGPVMDPKALRWTPRPCNTWQLWEPNHEEYHKSAQCCLQLLSDMALLAEVYI